MTGSHDIVRLMAWLSPVFPTGGFSYSSGLETAVQTGLIKNEKQLINWLTDLLQCGSARNDAILLCEAWRGYRNAHVVQQIGELALSLAGSAERYLEATAQGEAFTQAAKNWPETANQAFPDPCSLSVAVGIAAGCSKLDLRQTLIAYFHSFISNQLQAAIRLSIVGQSAASRILAQLESVVLEISSNVETTSLDDLGSATFMAEIMAMKHEELSGRMFRS